VKNVKTLYLIRSVLSYNPLSCPYKSEKKEDMRIHLVHRLPYNCEFEVEKPFELSCYCFFHIFEASKITVMYILLISVQWI
jgi:hypothetical protein